MTDMSPAGAFVIKARVTLVDPSIYKLAGEFADYVRAHAIIESGEQVVAIGDGGQAWGLLQMHPAFVQGYIHFTDIGTHDTWPEAQVKMCATYYRMRLLPNTPLDLVVQGFNLGWAAVTRGEPPDHQPKRNPDYLRRWSEAYQRIRAKP